MRALTDRREQMSEAQTSSFPLAPLGSTWSNQREDSPSQPNQYCSTAVVNALYFVSYDCIFPRYISVTTECNGFDNLDSPKPVEIQEDSTFIQCSGDLSLFLLGPASERLAAGLKPVYGEKAPCIVESEPVISQY